MRRDDMRRLAFLVPSALQAIVVLVSIPATVAASSYAEWGQIAVAQGVGGFAGTVVALGWGVTGPARVAVGTEVSRATLMSDSFFTKLTVFPFSFVASVAIAFYLVEGLAPSIVITAVLSTLTMGLAPTWYFIGADMPRQMILVESAPRAIIGLVGWVLVGLGGVTPLLGLSLQSMGVLFGFILAYLRYGRRQSRLPTLAENFLAIRAQGDGVVTQVGYSLFAVLPLYLLAAIKAPGVADFALIDRLQRQASTALAPLGNLLVARLASLPMNEVGGRSFVRHRIKEVAVLAVVAGLSASGAGVLLSSVLTGGQASPSWVLLAAMGGVVGLSLTSTTLPPLALAPLGRSGAAKDSALLTIVVGIPAVILGGLFGGPVGSEMALIFGLAAGVAWQIRYCLKE